MAACGLQPGRKGSGTGRTSMGDARYSRSSATMGMYNYKGKRMCLYICSMYCKVQNLVPIFMIVCIHIIKAANRQQHKQPK